jgi:aspartokinase-like uncharacterized kinase
MKPLVIKVGGGLLKESGALDAVCAAVTARAKHEPVVIVPGGGPFADAVREQDSRLRLSADTAHWMALLAMDQYAHLLSDRIEDASLVEEFGGIAPALAKRRIAVFAPARWLRAADVLPRSWDVTSDSVAAFVAGALDAVRLVLVKPTGAGADGVDPCFAMVVPVGLDVSVVPWRRFAGGADSARGAYHPS